MRETMGIMQHHDAVTGTEKQLVAYDYAKRLSVGMRTCNANARAILNVLAKGNAARTERHAKPRPFKFEFQTCSLLNISSCVVSEKSDQFILTLYNPLGHEANEYIRIPVPDVNYVVIDYNGKFYKSEYNS